MPKRLVELQAKDWRGLESFPREVRLWGRPRPLTSKQDGPRTGGTWKRLTHTPSRPQAQEINLVCEMATCPPELCLPVQ